MSNDQILNDHLQMLADNSARVRRAADKGTVRHARNIEGVSRYYSEAERMNAERIERNKPKDIRIFSKFSLRIRALTLRTTVGINDPSMSRINSAGSQSCKPNGAIARH